MHLKFTQNKMCVWESDFMSVCCCYHPRIRNPWTVAYGHCLIIFYSLCPHWIVLAFFFIPLLTVVSWLCAQRLHPGGFLGAWWIHRKPLIHTSVNTQARWRSDLRKGCMLQRLPALIRMHQITLSFPLLFVFLQNIISLSFLLSVFYPLPLVLYPLVAFPLLCLSVSPFLCLLDTLRFQSWWVTKEIPCCSQIPPSHP